MTYKPPSWVWDKYKPNVITPRDTSQYNSKLEAQSHTTSNKKKPKCTALDGQLRLDI